MKAYKLIIPILLFSFFSRMTMAQDKSPISIERFLQEAEISHMNGVALCILGKDQIRNYRLKKYAILTYSRYLSTNKKLKEIAKKKKFDLPELLPDQVIDAEELSAAEIEMNEDDRLVKLKHTFDLSYLQMVIEDNQAAIEFYDIASLSTDEDIKSYSVEMLPIIKKNLNEALKFTSQLIAKQ
ncbi:MAG: DUF4142 domain-containing protein [Bacteroidota bacterium]